MPTRRKPEVITAPVGTVDPYESVIAEIGALIEAARLTTAVAVNRSVTHLHWQIGCVLVEQTKAHAWGAKTVQRLSDDLRRQHPQARGFSTRNLQYMRQFAEAYDEGEVLVSLGGLPWSSNIVLLDQISDTATRLWYAARAVAEGWSKTVLAMQIETQLHRRIGTATTNFARTLPQQQSDLAQQLLKDHYQFDFLNLPSDASERTIERRLVENFRAFLLEMGRGFSFLGNQFRISVGGQDFFLDLLFYHIPTHRFVVFDLKIGAFEAEFAGKMSLYVNAVDDQLTDCQ